MSLGGNTWADANSLPTEQPSPPRPSFTITPLQRARMETNRRLALARQQLHGHHGTPGGSGIISSTSTNIPSSDLLTRQQEAVLRAVQQGCSVFITGSAGTGKSFLLGHIIAALRQIHPPDVVFVTASTGIAACAIGGQTLHSFAGIGLGRGDKDTLLRRVTTSHGAAKRWRRAAALVIDEISMIDGGVFDALEYIARVLRWQHRRWGGLQLVVSGDFFQLPPIKAPDPTKEFAFEADCWDSSFDLQVELTRVFRQSDSRLIDLLQGIRRGEPIPQPHLLRMLEPCSRGAGCDRDDEENVTRLFPRNDDVRRVNEERLRSLGREVITFVAADTGSEPWRSQLRQGIAPEVLEVCMGARVMLIKNTDPAAGLVNGSTGVVTGFIVEEREGEEEEEEEDRGGDVGRWRLLPRVRFERGGAGAGSVEVTVRRERWDVMEGEKVMARRTQVPLILAWALSVHKCQGMTLERLHTDLSRAFGCGMVYVALSRVRSLDGLRLSGGGFDPRKVRAHPKVVQFYHCRLSSSGRPPTPLLLLPAEPQQHAPPPACLSSDPSSSAQLVQSLPGSPSSAAPAVVDAPTGMSPRCPPRAGAPHCSPSSSARVAYKMLDEMPVPPKPHSPIRSPPLLPIPHTPIATDPYTTSAAGRDGLLVPTSSPLTIPSLASAWSTVPVGIGLGSIRGSATGCASPSASYEEPTC